MRLRNISLSSPFFSFVEKIFRHFDGRISSAFHCNTLYILTIHGKVNKQTNSIYFLFSFKLHFTLFSNRIFIFVWFLYASNLLISICWTILLYSYIYISVCLLIFFRISKQSNIEQIEKNKIWNIVFCLFFFLFHFIQIRCVMCVVNVKCSKHNFIILNNIHYIIHKYESHIFLLIYYYSLYFLINENNNNQ